MKTLKNIYQAYKAYILSPKGRYEYKHYILLLLLVGIIYLVLWGVLNCVM